MMVPCANMKNEYYLDKFISYFPGKDARILPLQVLNSGLHLGGGDARFGPSDDPGSNGTGFLFDKKKRFRFNGLLDKLSNLFYWGLKISCKQFDGPKCHRN